MQKNSKLKDFWCKIKPKRVNGLPQNKVAEIPTPDIIAERSLASTLLPIKTIRILTAFGISYFLYGTVFNSSTSATTTASLSLSNPNMTSTAITPGSTATVSTNVTVSVDNAGSYSLSLKVDNANLTNGSTTIVPGNVTNDNTWGYKWDNASTYTAPTTTGTNLTVPTLTNNSVSFTKNLTFGAKFSTSAEAGHYRGSGVLSLVATPATTTYTITYNANGGTNAPGSTTCTVQGSAGTSCTTTLSSSKPVKTNYTFLGWADSNTATVKQYDASGSITITSSKTIYAVWEYTITPGFTSITNMQQMTSNICSNAVIGAYKDLRDTRDNNTYRVIKMPDGKCWMAQNLKLSGSRTLTSSDSNVTSSYTLPSSTTYKESYTDPVIVTNPATGTIFPDNGSYKTEYGSYYNWIAATAGTGTQSMGTGNASGSICPKGWKLPSANGSTSDYYKLLNGISGADALKLPYSFLLSGGIDYQGNLSQALSSGDYWSSSAYDGNYNGTGTNKKYTSAYALCFSSGNIYQLGSCTLNSRYKAISVRCVAQ